MFNDPAGNRLEIFHGAETTTDPFKPGRAISGFRTGPLGMGHAVLHCEKIDDVVPFYVDILGFKLSDYFTKPFAVKHHRHSGSSQFPHHVLALLAPHGPNGRADAWFLQRGKLSRRRGAAGARADVRAPHVSLPASWAGGFGSAGSQGRFSRDWCDAQ